MMKQNPNQGEESINQTPLQYLAKFWAKKYIQNLENKEAATGEKPWVSAYGKERFEIAEKLNTQCVAFDYVHDNGKPMLVEISYGFSPSGYDQCKGYWDRNLAWNEGNFNPYGWMIDNLISSII